MMARCSVCGSPVPVVAFNPWVLREDLPTDDLVGIVLETLCDYSFVDLIDQQVAAEYSTDRGQYVEDVAALHVLREALRLLKGRRETPPSHSSEGEVGYVVVSPENKERLIREYGLTEDDFEEGA